MEPKFLNFDLHKLLKHIKEMKRSFGYYLVYCWSKNRTINFHRCFKVFFKSNGYSLLVEQHTWKVSENIPTFFIPVLQVDIKRQIVSHTGKTLNKFKHHIIVNVALVNTAKNVNFNLVPNIRNFSSHQTLYKLLLSLLHWQTLQKMFFFLILYNKIFSLSLKLRKWLTENWKDKILVKT